MNKKQLKAFSSKKDVSSGNTVTASSVKVKKTPVRIMEEKGISYDDAIKILADTADIEVFDNSGPDHATVVMANIFRTAKEHVRIFAGDLGGKVSKGVYLVELKNYLEKGNKLDLVLERKPVNTEGAENAFQIIEKYQKKNPSKVSISYVKSDNPFGSLGLHFTIGDDRMYRLETDTERFTARCSFNDKNFAYKLMGVFKMLQGTA